MLIHRTLMTMAICFAMALQGQVESNQIEHLKTLLLEKPEPEVTVQIYNDLAWEYYYADFDSAMRYVNKALALSDEVGDPYWRAVSLEMLAILKEMSGQAEEALNLYLDVIPLRESIGGQGLENTYNNLAVIFRNQENFDKALKYFQLSYELELKNGHKAGLAGSLVNIALVKMRLGQMDSIPLIFNEAIDLAAEVGESNLLCIAYLDFADYFVHTASLDSATYYYSEGYDLSEQIGDNGSKSVACYGLAEIAFMRSQYAKALEYLEESEFYARRINSIEYLKRIHYLRSDIYAKVGRYQEALVEQQNFIAAKDSLISLKIIGITNDLETKYESERKERQITALQLSSAKQALEAEASRNQRNGLLFAAVVLFSLAAFIAYRYRNQQRIAAVLSEKNKTIEIALRDRETLLKEIHHRVKNNLQVVSSLLSIQGREITDEKALEAVNESKNRVKSMALIHQYLYGDTDLKSIDMQQYIVQLSKSLFSAYRVDHDLVVLRTDIDPILLDVDTAVPLGIIINELVTNSLKYAFPEGSEGTLSISLKEIEGKLELRVKDDGVGYANIDPSNLSFGMKLLNAFKSKLDAEFQSISNKGVEAIYTIGKYKRIWAESTVS